MARLKTSSVNISVLHIKRSKKCISISFTQDVLSNVSLVQGLCFLSSDLLVVHPLKSGKWMMGVFCRVMKDPQRVTVLKTSKDNKRQELFITSNFTSTGLRRGNATKKGDRIWHMPSPPEPPRPQLPHQLKLPTHSILPLTPNHLKGGDIFIYWQVIRAGRRGSISMGFKASAFCHHTARVPFM